MNRVGRRAETYSHHRHKSLHDHAWVFKRLLVRHVPNDNQQVLQAAKSSARLFLQKLQEQKTAASDRMDVVSSCWNSWNLDDGRITGVSWTQRCLWAAAAAPQMKLRPLITSGRIVFPVISSAPSANFRKYYKHDRRINERKDKLSWVFSCSTVCMMCKACGKKTSAYTRPNKTCRSTKSKRNHRTKLGLKVKEFP